VVAAGFWVGDFGAGVGGPGTVVGVGFEVGAPVRAAGCGVGLWVGSNVAIGLVVGDPGVSGEGDGRLVVGGGVG